MKDLHTLIGPSRAGSPLPKFPTPLPIPGIYVTLLTFNGTGFRAVFEGFSNGFRGILDLAAKVGKILNTRMGSEVCFCH